MKKNNGLVKLLISMITFAMLSTALMSTVAASTTPSTVQASMGAGNVVTGTFKVSLSQVPSSSNVLILF